MGIGKHGEANVLSEYMSHHIPHHHLILAGLTLLGVAGALGLCGGGRMPKSLCGTFGGSWGPKRVFWPVAVFLGP